MAEAAYAGLLAEARACRLCADRLPLGPRPVLQASLTARLLILGQAPGSRVHESGIPWNDRSGDRLRAWLGLPAELFYDAGRVALIPIGLCYPGRDPRGGDRPPMPDCAPTWQARLRAPLAGLRLTLLVGGHAQAWTLGGRRRAGMTETVRAWRDYLPDLLPLPHPSWRTTGWEKRTPWFAEDLLPELRARVREALA